MSIFTKKSYGQHWLKSKVAVNKIVEASKIRKKDLILEIGPGTGLLTEALLEKTKNLFAVEADPDLIEKLRNKFGPEFNLIEGDVLKFSNKDLVGKARVKYKVVANLPYNIASRILRKFLTQDPRPSEMVVMVQKEVADRMGAKPPNMSVIGVMCQLYSDVSKVCKVKPGAFVPPPQVDSAVVKLELKPVSRWRIKNIEAEAVVRLAKVGFSSRRKQLQRNLANGRIISSDRARDILSKMGLSEEVRAEELTVKDWVSLFKAISSLK